MRGLDPRIHDGFPNREPYALLCLRSLIMDCRVEPGNDRVESDARFQIGEN